MMHGMLLDFIRSSDAFVLSAVRRCERVSVGDSEFLRIDAEVSEAFKGLAPGQENLLIDVRMAGKETPVIEVGKEYLFFLAPADLDHQGRRKLLDLTWPVAVGTERRGDFVRLAREAADIARRPVSDADLKAYVFAMLQSDIGFFQADAARQAVNITRWNDSEVERLTTILHRNGHQPPLAVADFDNVATVVVQHGSIARVVDFAKAQLKNDQTDPIYFGLFRRADPSVDQILWDLLKDPDATVRTGALRVVGLLRRADILDRFVKESTSAQDQRTREALATARALVVRD
jgi:hypothetical protein